MYNKKYNYTELPEHVNLVKEYIRTTYPEEYNNFEEKLFDMTQPTFCCLKPGWIKRMKFQNALYNFGIKIAKDPILSRQTKKYMLTNILSFSPTVDIEKEPFKETILEAMNGDSAQEKFQPIAEAVENEFSLTDKDVAYTHRQYIESKFGNKVLNHIIKAEPDKYYHIMEPYLQSIFDNCIVQDYVKQVAPDDDSYHIIQPQQQPKNQQNLANQLMKYLQLCNAYTAMTERDYIKATSQNI